jgi:hypothetical protein
MKLHYDESVCISDLVCLFMWWFCAYNTRCVAPVIPATHRLRHRLYQIHTLYTTSCVSYTHSMTPVVPATHVLWHRLYQLHTPSDTGCASCTRSMTPVVPATHAIWHWLRKLWVSVDGNSVGAACSCSIFYFRPAVSIISGARVKTVVLRLPWSCSVPVSRDPHLHSIKLDLQDVICWGLQGFEVEWCLVWCGNASVLV